MGVVSGTSSNGGNGGVGNGGMGGNGGCGGTTSPGKGHADTNGPNGMNGANGGTGNCLPGSAVVAVTRAAVLAAKPALFLQHIFFFPCPSCYYVVHEDPCELL
jgi:hypothetical protein